jgi:hypothetical protein
MKIIIYIFATFLLPTFLPGQQYITIKGQVTDAVTHEPLNECHVYVSCKHLGTVTDADGGYTLEIPTCCMTQCLIISHMGYQKYIVPVHDVSKETLNVQLEYGGIVLAELIITPDHYRVIYPSKFEPFRSGDMELLIADEVYIQAMSQKKIAKLYTMF